MRWVNVALATLLLLAAGRAGTETITLGQEGEQVQLKVAAEHRCAPYDRSDYPYPQTVEDALIKEYGGIYSPYTGERFASKRQTDIEHIVAISEAHDSGLCAAPKAVKRQFARDTLNLTLAAPHLNRAVKRAKDAAEWLPAMNRCWFAHRVLAVKAKYALTVDRREAAALTQVLSQCPTTTPQITAR